MSDARQAPPISVTARRPGRRALHDGQPTGREDRTTIRADGWLASVLGHPVYRVDAPGLDVEPTLTDHAAAQGDALYYARIPADDTEAARRLTGLGFYLVEVRVTLEHAARAFAAAAAVDAGIREVTSGDEEAVLDIAARAFRYTRFHLDPRVPRQAADAVKREWVASYLRQQRGDRLFVALHGGRAAAFLAVLAADEHGRRIRVIDLVAVDPAFQGRSLGERLVRFFVARYRGEADVLRVGTQGANVPSLRLYEKCGFSVRDTGLMLHRHVGRWDRP